MLYLCDSQTQISLEVLFNILNSIAPLDTEEQDAIAAITTVQAIPKGELWVREGIRPHSLAFLKEGYLRKYYLRGGKEITDYFYFEHSFSGDLPSIVTNKPSLVNVIAMEPTVLLTLPYAALNALCRKHHTIEHIMRILVERVFITFYYRSVSFISATPKERYEQLIREQPLVSKRAMQYHIASFLGITPQHLSRLRASR